MPVERFAGVSRSKSKSGKKVKVGLAAARWCGEMED